MDGEVRLFLSESVRELIGDLVTWLVSRNLWESRAAASIEGIRYLNNQEVDNPSFDR